MSERCKAHADILRTTLPQGYPSMLDLVLAIPTHRPSPEKIDAEAVCKDWAVTGDDIRHAFQLWFEERAAEGIDARALVESYFATCDNVEEDEAEEPAVKSSSR